MNYYGIAPWHNKIIGVVAILRLDGCAVEAYKNSTELIHFDGIYKISDYGTGQGIYRCYDENGISKLLKRKDILRLCTEVIDAKEPHMWIAHPGLYFDERQDPGTFNSTLWFILITFFLVFIKGGCAFIIPLWIYYLFWKSSKYN